MSSILVISPVSSHPPQNGARRRIHSLLSLLKARGHRIHFVYTACEKVDLTRMKMLMEADWEIRTAISDYSIIHMLYNAP